MAWIEVVPDGEWDGELGSQRAKVVDKKYDKVDNILAVHSLNPAAMAAHTALYQSAMAGTKTLRKVERELLALVVSQLNQCHY